LNRNTDILIIGGGILGLGVAYYAAKLKLGRITLIESNKIGRGASSRNIGVIREQFDNAAMVNLMHQSIDLWQELCSDLSWNLLFDQKGRLTVARSEDTMQRITQAVKLQNSLGVKSKLLSAKEAIEMLPFLNREELYGATFNQRDGMIHHDAVLWAFERALRENNVEIIEGIECMKIISVGGKAIGIESSIGDIRAEKIVVAAGSYTRSLLLTVGVDLPLITLRREAMVTEPYKHFLPVVFTDALREFVITQTLRGEVVGDTKYADDSSVGQPLVTLTFARRIAKDIRDNFPRLANITLLRQWAGIYNTTSDKLGVVGQIASISNLFVVTGFGGQGFMVSPAVGKSTAEFISLGKEPDVLKPFDCSRFL
jgi:sarcosine oxidase subunit beta